MKEMSEKNKNKELKTAGGFTLVRKFLSWIANKQTQTRIMKILGALAIALGIFIAGRQTVKPKTETATEYLPGEPIEIEIPVPVPVEVIKPIDSANVILDCIKSGKFADLFPERVRDSIVYVTKEDTAAVLIDWATERIYEQKVFDIDTVGTATIKAKSQYNRITWLSSTFVPVVKHTTVTDVIRRKYAPFAGAGITTMPEIVINGGMYFDDKYGISLLYEYNWQVEKHAVGLMGTYKF